MANQKISQLTDGTPLQSTDQLPINRAGVNFKVTGVEARANKDAANGYAGLDASALLKNTEFPLLAGVLACPTVLPIPATLSTNHVFTAVANQVNFIQFTLPYRITLTKCSWILNTISSGTVKFSFAIYDSTGASKLVDSGVFSLTSSSNSLAVSNSFSSVTLSPGVYYFAWTADTITTGSTNTFSGYSSSNMSILINANAKRFGKSATASVAGAAISSLDLANATSFVAGAAANDLQIPYAIFE